MLRSSNPRKSNVFDWSRAVFRRIEFESEKMDEVFYTFSVSITHCIELTAFIESAGRTVEFRFPYLGSQWAPITLTRALDFCELCDLLLLDR